MEYWIEAFLSLSQKQKLISLQFFMYLNYGHNEFVTLNYSMFSCVYSEGRPGVYCSWIFMLNDTVV